MIYRFIGGAALVCVACAAGCQRPMPPVFPEHQPPIVWPPAPDPPRIRYIGSLSGEACLGKPAAGWSLGSLLAGPTPAIRFSTPMSVAVRGDQVFVADGQNAAVYAMNLADRSFKTIDRADGRRLEWPIDVALAGDALAVADSRRAAVFLFSRDGAYLRSIGSGSLKRPAAVGWNSDTGEFWVLDAAEHACLIFDRQGSLRRTIGRRGAGPAEFNYPAGMTIDAGMGIVIADSMNFRVQILDQQGALIRVFGRKGDAAGDFALPRDVAADSEGHLYVLDSQFENIQVFDREGRLLMAMGQEGRKPGEFYLPSGIAIDELDRIWVADTYNRRVQVFQYLRELSR